MPDVRPEDREAERHFTISIGEEERVHSFRIEDERWARDQQIRDWLKLAVLIAIVLGYHLLIYFLEPGIR